MTNEKTPTEKLKELEKEQNEFLAKVEVEKQKFEEKRKHLILEEKERKRKEVQDFKEDLAKQLLNDYHIGCKEIALMIVDRAWEDAHSYGYSEVRYKAEDLAEFIENVIKINRSKNE